MAKQPAKQTTRQKAVRIALIPLLVAVLLAVFFWPDEQSDDVVIDPLADAVQASAKQPDEPSVASESDALATRQQLQRMELSRILEHDPFALPIEVSKELNAEKTPTEEQAAARERQRIAAVVESIQQEKLNAVYRDDKGVSAILGNRVVHEGDEIESGIRILKITPQGLTLEVSAETTRATVVE